MTNVSRWSSVDPRRMLAIIFMICVVRPADVVAGGGSGAKILNLVRIRNSSSTDPAIPLVSLDTVPVGDAGNAAVVVNGSSVGAVSAPFRMAKFEVTIAEYTRFLNAVGTRTDGLSGAVVESLYDTRMGSDANVAGITRSGSGTESAPYVYSVVGDRKKPIVYITWFNAARFANWMHNGATATASIETGAYVLDGALSGTFTKEPGALWWIPTQDEWFKAAYYRGGGTNTGYWQFPTQSNSFCGNTSSGGSNQANFQRLGVFSVTQSSTLDSTQNYLTAVGTFASAPGPYGTFDQGGNVEEWTDTVVVTGFGDARITRGGAWNSGGLNSDVNPTPTALPTDRLSKLGFRLARAVIDQGAPVTLSGTFLVRVGSADSMPRTITPGEIVQFSVRRGAFTVFAADGLVQTTSTSKSFTTGNNRTTFINVTKSDNQIVVAQAPEGTQF